MPLILGGNKLADTGYDVANSLKFNDDDSAQLAITPSSDGSAEKWTLSFWMKMGGLTTDQRTVRAYAVSSSGSRSAIYFDASDQFSVGFNPSGSSWTTCTLQDNSTNMRFRDPAAWTHFVVACDTTQGTAANRLKGYVNGVQKTFDAYPAEDMDTMYNKSGRAQYIGWRGYTTGYLDDYLAEVYWIDGTQYAASDFGEYDEDSPRIWKPKDSSGLTFGTNGYYLDFEDSSALGNDAAGSNNLTVTNLAAIDQMTDTPTNNFATLNPLEPSPNALTFTEGNLVAQGSGGNGGRFIGGTFALGSGKWWCEVKVTVSGSYPIVGIIDSTSSLKMNSAYFVDSDSGTNQSGFAVFSNSDVYHNGDDNFGDFGVTYTTGDIISVGLNMDASPPTITFQKNGGDEETFDTEAPNSGLYTFPAIGAYFPAAIAEVNFGNSPFTISSGNADENGYGSFEYAPKSGYYSCCTKNLAEFGG